MEKQTLIENKRKQIQPRQTNDVLNLFIVFCELKIVTMYYVIVETCWSLIEWLMR
jgi:hypothetical protein